MKIACPSCTQPIELTEDVLSELAGTESFGCPNCGGAVPVPEGGETPLQSAPQGVAPAKRAGPAADSSGAQRKKGGIHWLVLIAGLVVLCALGGVAVTLALKENDKPLPMKAGMSKEEIQQRFFTNLIITGVTTAADLEAVTHIRSYGTLFLGISKEGMTIEESQDLAERTGAQLLRLDDTDAGSRKDLEWWAQNQYRDFFDPGAWLWDQGEVVSIDAEGRLSKNFETPVQPALLQWQGPREDMLAMVKAEREGRQVPDMNKPVKVFVLMGEINMIGAGREGPSGVQGTLKNLVFGQGKYSHLIGPLGRWERRKDVRFVHVNYSNDKVNLIRNEWLTVDGNIGPEVEFGHKLGNHFEEPVLIVKSCNGNRSLGWDLLPPGSERFEHGGQVYAGYKESPPSWPKGSTPRPVEWYAGKQYDGDILAIREVLENLDDYYPDANGYELVGFGFWQGFKDLNPAHASQYERNLANFIKALRSDFGSPDSKFVCATIGFGGYQMDGLALEIARAQLAVSGDSSKYQEFLGNVMTVDTREFWRDQIISPVSRGNEYNHNAETFMEVGAAMGRAMIDLLRHSEK